MLRHCLTRYSRTLCGRLQILARQQHTDAQDEFRETVREFASRVVAPRAAEIDSSNSFPKDANIWTLLGDFGLHGARCSDVQSPPPGWVPCDANEKI